MNKKLLKVQMILHDDGNAELAEALGCSTTTLSAKMNENGGLFNTDDIKVIKKRYKLNPVQLDEIFLT